VLAVRVSLMIIATTILSLLLLSGCNSGGW